MIIDTAFKATVKVIVNNEKYAIENKATLSNVNFLSPF